MLIFGWGDKNNVVGITSVRKCSRCGNESPWVVYETKKQFKLYWVPIARWSKRFIVQCMVCPNSSEVAETEARRLVAEGERQGREQFLRAVAAIFQAIARVGGIESREWARAVGVLIQFSEGSLTTSAAEHLLREVSDADLNVSHLDEEQRLVLLRVAAEIALADLVISPKEVSALEVLAARLGFGAQVVHALIEMLTGSKAGAARQSEADEACRVLGVQPGASIAEIRSAYKRMMLKHHPDRVPPEQREAATRKAAEINDAYDLLIGRGTKSGMGNSGATGTRPSQSDQASGARRSGTSSTTTHTSQCVRSGCTAQVSTTSKFCGTCGHPQT